MIFFFFYFASLIFFICFFFFKISNNQTYNKLNIQSFIFVGHLNPPLHLKVLLFCAYIPIFFFQNFLFNIHLNFTY